MPASSIPDLARNIAQIRFARTHHLPLGPEDLEELAQTLLRPAPFPPLALNLRAFTALPETDLPPPPECLSESASAFTKGDYGDALKKALALDSKALEPEEQARLYTTIGDLLRQVKQQQPDLCAKLAPHLQPVTDQLALMQTDTARITELLYEARLRPAPRGSRPSMRSGLQFIIRVRRSTNGRVGTTTRDDSNVWLAGATRVSRLS